MSSIEVADSAYSSYFPELPIDSVLPFPLQLPVLPQGLEFSFFRLHILVSKRSSQRCFRDEKINS